MKETPKYFDAESPPRIYGKRGVPIDFCDDIPPTIASLNKDELEIGLSTRAAIAVFLLALGVSFLMVNGRTLVKCFNENVVCEFE